MFTAQTPPRPYRGFTLIELLVVIAIIGLLTTVGLILANKVTGGGKARLTSDTIRILDTLVSAYQGDVGEKIPTRFTDRDVGGGKEYPFVDGRLEMPVPSFVGYSENNPAEPSLGLFLLSAIESPSVDGAIKSLDSKLVQRILPLCDSDSSGILSGLYSQPMIRDPNAPVPNCDPDSRDDPDEIEKRERRYYPWYIVKDGWGAPIRFVHPKLDGGYGDYVLSTGSGVNPRAAKTISVKGPGGVAVDRAYIRSIRNAAGAVGSGDEGKCPGNQPYFYSAGNDKNPGNREDNVYSTKPTYPSETAKEP